MLRGLVRGLLGQRLCTDFAGSVSSLVVSGLRSTDFDFYERWLEHDFYRRLRCELLLQKGLLLDLVQGTENSF